MKLSVVSLIALFSTALFVNQTALAQTSPYYGEYPQQSGPFFYAGIGPAFTQNGEITEFTGFIPGNKISYETGYAVEIGGGYAFNPFVAVGLEGGWVANEIKRTAGFASSDSFLYNAPILGTLTLQYPIPNTIVTPFVRAGVGGAATIFDTDFFSNGSVDLLGDDSDFVFAYELEAGVRFNINENMSVGIAYKYFETDESNYEYKGFFGPDVRLGIEGVRSHIVMASFNMRF